MTIRNKRILRDIKDVMTEESFYNIHYSYDEDRIDVGYALIYGTDGTPYAYGCYLFKIEFTDNYPFEPPIVTFITGDGMTRFHPNFYVNGKVCLSILNTWPGERWSACQSLSSILLNISSLFDEQPLLYEPGISYNHMDFDNYHKIISYKNIEVAILSYLEESNIPTHFKRFYDIIKSLFYKNIDKIITLSNKPNMDINIVIYGNMSCRCNYEVILNKITNYKN
jgi:ubiquitin-conjugating enzyme E2 Z